ncbi:MAG TPA: class F sortase [Dehalococcoidia bacterium]|nr:class F sortase [Dehalococcoidia bacterium]
MGVVLGALALSVGACGGGSKTKSSGPSLAPAESGGLAASATPVTEGAADLTARPTAAVAENLTSIGSGDRFVISKFGVDAPLTYRKVGKDGQMPNPDGPDDVAYYDFTDWPGLGGGPGKGGNAVFAGHVDSGQKACKNGTVKPPCQAVLWDLNGLKVGDEIEVRVSGQSFKYRVMSNQPVPAATGPWDQIVSATAQESLTIITCGGDFNRETREYNNRQVVVAVRA